MAPPILTTCRILVAAFWLLTSIASHAADLLVPGDLQLRHDLLLLNDRGVTNVPLTTWPVPVGDIRAALGAVEPETLDAFERAAFERLRGRLTAGNGSASVAVSTAVAVEPRFIRTFEDTPRDEGSLQLVARWQWDHVSAQLAVAVVANPFDGDDIVPDGTRIAVGVGNWTLAAGWVERWYGPGHDGSLILGTNARPTPGISLQRNISSPFVNKWLSWIGPWSLSTFMTVLDDERVVDNAWLFGVRGSARPLPGLEIGVSRTAQWCGEGRPCDLPTFGDLLVGNDNRGVNVAPEDEPGNQLGGIDIRWSLPREIPLALYMQWIGEDGRGGGGSIGSWLRQAGVEFWGSIGDASYRTHLEISDTTCHEGGFGFSASKPNCGYEHSTYQSGYRYRGRSLAHGTDNDSLSYSIGSTLVQSAGHTWNATLRYMEINREGQDAPRHTLSPIPQERLDMQLTHRRQTSLGHIYLGVGYQRIEGQVTGETTSDVAAFFQWSSR